MYSHHLQWFQTLDHPAMSLADPGGLHAEEGIRHAAPQHSDNGLHIHSRRALWDWIPVLALKYGRWEWHSILRAKKESWKIILVNWLTFILSISSWQTTQIASKHSPYSPIYAHIHPWQQLSCRTDKALLVLRSRQYFIAQLFTLHSHANWKSH